MRYLSLFSGVEGATLAFAPLGWEAVAFSEIEPLPCALLAQRYPNVPNLGDITKVTEEQIRALGKIDVVIGGFPCQDVSVAGARAGLEDEEGKRTRSGLFHDAMRIIRWAAPRWVVVENVPGLFSSAGGRDFATVVGALAGLEFDVPDGGWRNAGVAAGPLGLVEWAVLNAEFFGVAQRRSRVFLVRDSGAWADRPPVLLERESLRGDPPPSREAGARAAATLTGGSDRGGRAGRRLEDDVNVVVGDKHPDVASCLTGSRGGADVEDAQANWLVAHPGEVAPTLGANHGNTRIDAPMVGDPGTPFILNAAESADDRNAGRKADRSRAIDTKGGYAPSQGGTVVAHAVTAHQRRLGDGFDETFVTHALRAEGADASEDGSGRGTPIVAGTLAASDGRNRGLGGENEGDRLVVGTEPVAFRKSRRAANADDDETWVDDGRANTLNGFDVGERDTHAIVEPTHVQDVADPIVANEGATWTHEGTTFRTRNVTAYGAYVRRLTPLECERLQGLPDGHTAIEMRGKPAADSPRYRAIGNGFAIPCVRWIGERIEAALRYAP